MSSDAKTVDEYLDSMPEDRRAAISAVRQAILQNLPEGYEEGMQYGMIGYYVPHSLFPDGYHCDPTQPLNYAAIASQKNHMALYLMGVYGHEETRAWFVNAWKATGKKLDMGAACVRFKKLEDVPLEVLGQAVARLPADSYVANYVRLRDSSKSRQKKR